MLYFSATRGRPIILLFRLYFLFPQHLRSGSISRCSTLYFIPGGIMSKNLADYPLLLNTKHCAELFEIGPRTWQKYLVGGKLPPSIKLAGRRVWRRVDIEMWIDLGCPNEDEFNRRKEVV